MSVSSRLKEFCKIHKIPTRELIEKGFGSSQTINNYMNGKTDVKAAFLEQFIKEYKAPADWLMTGIGEISSGTIINENQSVYGICKNCLEKDRTIEAQRKTIEAQERYIAILEEHNEKKDVKDCG